VPWHVKLRLLHKDCGWRRSRRHAMFRSRRERGPNRVGRGRRL